MRGLWGAIVGIVVLAVIIFLISQLVIGGYVIASADMQPELQIGDRLLINKMAYSFSGPSRGDIVYYRSLEASSPQLKRVVGLPGDIVEIKNRTIYVNGIQLVEPYVKNPPEHTLPPLEVPPGHFLVLEDNRTNSDYSSSERAVPQQNIMGRAWILAWPPDKWGTIQVDPPNLELTSVQTP